MFEKVRQEITSNDALVELNTAEIALRVLQAVVKQSDRNDAVIRDAAETLKVLGYPSIQKSLLRILVPMELSCSDEIIRVCSPVTLF